MKRGLLLLGSILVFGGCRSRPAATTRPATGLPATPRLGAPLDRVGRPLTANALVGPLAPEGVGDRRKEQYNHAPPSEWPSFAPDIRETLGLYDGLDGACGNQWRADHAADGPARYAALAAMLADDRLWVDSRQRVCARFLAVELASPNPPGDCGGRTPTEDAVDVYRSLLVFGKSEGVDDGVAHDDRAHSSTAFPFLAAP